MKVILDTNVIIAAYAARGLCSAVFELCLERHSLILSRLILSEVKRNLVSQLHVPQAAADEIYRFLEKKGKVIDCQPLSSHVCRDPEDDHVLALASHSKAEVIVSGDKDLLVLKRFESIPILTPREFWELQRRR